MLPLLGRNQFSADYTFEVIWGGERNIMCIYEGVANTRNCLAK